MVKKSKKKGWKYVVKNKGKIFGETNYEKKTISINKKEHAKAKKVKKGAWKKYGMAKKDLSLINTLVHETRHKTHPKETEKTVRKKSAIIVKGLSPKAKAKYYNLIKK